MTRKPPIGFLCYAWKDDGFNSRITHLRALLGSEVGSLIGEDFPIFQDRTDLKWGELWAQRIEHSLDAVTFLFPFITPRFFRSDECRKELARFLEREEQLGRKRLVMPVYYIRHAALEDRTEWRKDPLLHAVASRQRADWRDLRLAPEDSHIIPARIAEWALHVADALHKAETAPAGSARTDTSASPTNPTAGALTISRLAVAEVKPSGESLEELLRLIDERALTPEHYKQLIWHLRRRAHHDLDEGDRGYFEFVTTSFVDFIYEKTPFFREDFNSNVLLHELGDAELYGDGTSITKAGYLRWQRDIDYYLHALRDDCEDDIVSQTSNVVDPSMLLFALKHTRFGIEVRAGNQRGASLLNWDISWRLKPGDADANAQTLRTRGELTGEVKSRGRTIFYSASYRIEESGEPVLDFSFRIPWKFGRERLWVRVWEHQLLRRDENFYHLNIRHPTKGIRANMRLGQGLQAWNLLEPTLAPDKYPKERDLSGTSAEANSGDDEMGAPNPHYRTVTLPTWVLPGIALLLEWRYPMTDRLFDGSLQPRPLPGSGEDV
jgi:TIR domain